MTTLQPATSFYVSAIACLPAPAATRPPRSLAEAAQAAADSIPEAGLRPVPTSDAAFMFRPKLILGLLTYCYARHVYSSVEIERLIKSDATLIQFCRSGLLSANMLRQFRRENRETLETCLAAVLAYQARMAAGEQSSAEGLFADEAEHRVLTAILTDESRASVSLAA